MRMKIVHRFRWEPRSRVRKWVCSFLIRVSLFLEVYVIFDYWPASRPSRSRPASSGVLSSQSEQLAEHPTVLLPLHGGMEFHAKFFLHQSLHQPCPSEHRYGQDQEGRAFPVTKTIVCICDYNGRLERKRKRVCVCVCEWEREREREREREGGGGGGWRWEGKQNPKQTLLTICVTAQHVTAESLFLLYSILTWRTFTVILCRRCQFTQKSFLRTVHWAWDGWVGWEKVSSAKTFYILFSHIFFLQFSGVQITFYAGLVDRAIFFSILPPSPPQEIKWSAPWEVEQSMWR